MIIDTNILIDFLKGKKEAVDFISQAQPLQTSVIVVSELFSGVSNNSEMVTLRDFLLFVDQVGINAPIAEQAGLLRRKYYKSHGITIPDALIAATAAQLKVPIATLDKKHFSVLSKELVIPY